MRNKTRFNGRVLLGAVAITAVLGGSAFTASNTMPASTKAGSGTVTASGYTATKIDYTLDSADPKLVSQVDVNVSGTVPTTSNAKVQLASAGSWYGCTIGALVNPDGIANNGDEHSPLTCTTAGTKTSVSATQDVILVIVD